MSEALNIKPVKEPIPRSWVPRVILGGKMPPDDPPPPENWLKDLDIGTVFVCTTNNWAFGDLYQLVFKGEKFYLLEWTKGDGSQLDCYVEPIYFCEKRQLYEVLGEDKLPTRGDNNERDRTD